MTPHEKFVRGILPDAYLCECGYELKPRFLVYAKKIGCPALTASRETESEAWIAAARILGYYAPRQEEGRPNDR